jgi:hypothetical protein
MTTPCACDGSCFAAHNSGDEITCEDGEVLVFIRCIHDDTWYLTTLAPPITIKED